jgi:hypothetical protein
MIHLFHIQLLWKLQEVQTFLFICSFQILRPSVNNRNKKKSISYVSLNFWLRFFSKYHWLCPFTFFLIFYDFLLNYRLFFYLLVLHPVAHLSNWFLMMPSIATKFEYINLKVCCDWRHHKEPVNYRPWIKHLSPSSQIS